MKNDWMDAETRVERAHIFSRQALWVDAAKELQAAVQVNPTKPLWFFNLGLALDMTGDVAGACRAFESARQLDSRDIETLNCLGISYTKLGKYAQALDCFNKIQKLDPMYEPAYCNRIELYTEIGQHEEAELMFYLARQVEDECPTCYFNIAISHYARGDYERAIDCWKQTLRIDPDYTHANSRIGDAYWAMGNLEAASEFYISELDVTGDELEVLLDLGEVLKCMGKYDESQEYLRRAAAISPMNANILFNQAEVALRQGHHSVARGLFRRVLMIDPKFIGANLKLAKLLLKHEDRWSIDRYLTAEMNNCGNNVLILKKICVLYMKLELAVRAKPVLDKLVKIRPADPELRVMLADCHAKLCEYDDVIENCRIAIAIDHDCVLAYCRLAKAYHRLGNYEQAKKVAVWALENFSDNKHVEVLCEQLGISKVWSKLKAKLTPRKKA